MLKKITLAALVALMAAHSAYATQYQFKRFAPGMRAAQAAKLTLTPLSYLDTGAGNGGGIQASTLTNTGSVAVPLAASGDKGVLADTADFFFPGPMGQKGTCASLTELAAGASCTIRVGFRPQIVGQITGSLSVTAGSASVTANLSGTGVPAPHVTLSAAALLEFTGSYGSTTAPQSITVSSTGTAPLTLSNLVQQQGSGAEFQRSGSCTEGLTLNPGESCTFTYTWTPSWQGSSGAEDDATLTFTTNTLVQPLTLSLRGIFN